MLTADNGVRVGNAFARRDGSPSRQLVALRGEGGSWCVRCDVCNIANILAVGKLRDPSADLRDIASQAKRHVGAWKSLLNHRPVREHWRQPVWKSNIQPDFNVRICDSFDASTSAVLRELAESHRFVQKSAESTSI